MSYTTFSLNWVPFSGDHSVVVQCDIVHTIDSKTYTTAMNLPRILIKCYFFMEVFTWLEPGWCL